MAQSSLKVYSCSKDMGTTSNYLQSTNKSAFRHMKWENFFAGICGGVLATVTLHPLDLVKIRFQVNEGVAVVANGVCRPSYSGVVDAFRSIYGNQGICGLYQGVKPNVLGAGASWGLYFLFYNSTKAHLQERQGSSLGPTQHLFAAASAGLLTTTLGNPVSVVKTRLCLQYENDRIIYSGIIDCFRRTYRCEGIAGLYKGYLPGLLGVSHGALQYMVYEELKNAYNHELGRALDHRLTSAEYITFAALSKVCSSVVTYPLQVLRARLQDQHTTYTGVGQLVHQLLRHEGVKGFYKGFSPYLIHVIPSVCIVFLVYEKVVHVTSS